MRFRAYKIPEFWEMESSGIPENKAIHVYSNTADLTVYDMSHNPYTSDGSYIIPDHRMGYGLCRCGLRIALTKAAATMCSISLRPASLPRIRIILSSLLHHPAICANVRAAMTMAMPTRRIIVFPQGVPQSFQLNKGQCMQFMPVKAQDPDNYRHDGNHHPFQYAGGR